MFNDCGRGLMRSSRRTLNLPVSSIWPFGRMQSLVQAYFEGYESFGERFDCGAGGGILLCHWQFEHRLIDLQPGACELDVGHALLELAAYWAALAAAVVVCLVNYGQRGEGLEAEYQHDSQGGQKPSGALAHVAKSSESKHC